MVLRQTLSLLITSSNHLQQAWDLGFPCEYSRDSSTFNSLQLADQSLHWFPSIVEWTLQPLFSWNHSCIQTLFAASCQHLSLDLFQRWFRPHALGKALRGAHSFFPFGTKTATAYAHCARTWKRPSGHRRYHATPRCRSWGCWPSLWWTANHTFRRGTDCALAGSSVLLEAGPCQFGSLLKPFFCGLSGCLDAWYAFWEEVEGLSFRWLCRQLDAGGRTLA